MKKLRLFLMLAAISYQNLSNAAYFLPLTTWIKDKQFSTLSVDDTVTLTLRCSVAYEVNRSILESFTNLKAEGLRNRVDTYRKVSAGFSAILVKEKKQADRDIFMKSMLRTNEEIYDFYMTSMRNNQPIPFSLNTEILATDIGVCNSLDEKIFDAQRKMFQ